jgi:hypothetical protein
MDSSFFGAGATLVEVRGATTLGAGGASCGVGKTLFGPNATRGVGATDFGATSTWGVGTNGFGANATCGVGAAAFVKELSTTLIPGIFLCEKDDYL